MFWMLNYSLQNYTCFYLENITIHPKTSTFRSKRNILYFKYLSVFNEGRRCDSILFLKTFGKISRTIETGFKSNF